MSNIVEIQCSHCTATRKIPASKLGAVYNKRIKYNCKECGGANSVKVNAELLNKKKGNAMKIQIPSAFQTNILTRSEGNVVGDLAKIEVLRNDLTGHHVLVLQLGENIIGRKGSTSEENKRSIPTEDRKMSRSHCIISVLKREDNRYEYLLSDNSSTNGTYHNGRKLDKYEEVYLKSDAEIKIGITKLKLSI